MVVMPSNVLEVQVMLIYLSNIPATCTKNIIERHDFLNFVNDK